MKNVFKLIGVIALVAVIGFSMIACKDGDGDTETGGSLTNVKNANVYYLNDDDGTIGTLLPSSMNGKVFLEVYGEGSYEDLREVGNITNGKLTFTLPDLSADVTKGYLAADAFNGWTVNPPDSKILFAGEDEDALYVLLDNGDEGILTYGYFENNSFHYIINTYIDRSTTVFHTENDNTGTFTVDCTLTKGWNIVYNFENSVTKKISTNSSIVNTAKMKWIFVPD